MATTSQSCTFVMCPGDSSKTIVSVSNQQECTITFRAQQYGRMQINGELYRTLYPVNATVSEVAELAKRVAELTPEQFNQLDRLPEPVTFSKLHQAVPKGG